MKWHRHILTCAVIASVSVPALGQSPTPVSLANSAEGKILLATRGTDLYRVWGQRVDRFTLTDSLHTLCRTNAGRLIGVSNTPVGGFSEVYELTGAETGNPTLVQIGQVPERYPTLTDINGTLYATRDVDFLVTLDASTFAQTSVVGNLGLPQGIGGSAYDPAGDRFFLTNAATGSLHRVDYTNAAAVTVGGLGVPFRNQGAQWFGGKYYTALERTDSNEFVVGRVNVNTGAFTQDRVLETGISFPLGSTVGLAVIPATTGGSAQKATGGVFFMNGQRTAHASFNAHEAFRNQPAKGMLHYSDTDGVLVRWYQASVNCVDVEGDDATFSGPLIGTNVPEWQGRWVQVWVHDGGTPGRRGDRIGGDFFTGPGCLPLGPTPPAWIDVLGGNLVVHR